MVSCLMFWLCCRIFRILAESSDAQPVIKSAVKFINYADCSLRRGARHLKGTYSGDFLYVFSLIFGSIWAHKGSYGPIWAHMGPYGPIWARPGPLKSGKSKKKTHFLSNTFFLKIFVFDLQTAFFDGKTVFFKFLAEICLGTLIKSPQKASSRPKICKFRTTCTLP